MQIHDAYSVCSFKTKAAEAAYPNIRAGLYVCLAQNDSGSTKLAAVEEL
jgi:hypothetical protein